MALTLRFKAGEDKDTVLTKLNERAFPVVSATSDIGQTFYGMVIFNTTDLTLYRFDGTAFVPLVGPQQEMQSIDLIVNNSTILVGSFDLNIPVVPSGIYLLESEIIVDSSAAADSVVAFSGPASSNIRLSFWQDGTAASATQANLFHDAADLASVQIGGISLGTMLTFRASGWFINGPNIGSMQVQYSQNVAAAINSRLVAGSWLRMTKVG